MMDRNYKIPSHILDDLCSRFILNIPDEYKQNPIRLFFQIELAHWFYIDFIVPENQGLKSVGIKEFTIQVFDHCPFLHPGSDNCEKMLQDWRAYKLTVPKYGVILLDPTMSYVLLVQGFSKSWGFPKGKVNEVEEPIKCAQRELYEETGYDVCDTINPDHFLEHYAGDQYSKLYIVPGISLDTHFQPQSRNEIKAMQWFPLDCLPAHKKDVSHAKELGCGPNSFFMVVPFMKPLRRWITQNPYSAHTTPDSARKKTEAQLAFAKKSLNQFEEILRFDNASPPVQKSPVGKRHGRRNVPGQNYNKGARSPAQYTLLQKDRRGEDFKKLHQIKQTLDIGPSETKKSAILFKSEPHPFQPCKEWKSFKLDIGAIMKQP